MLGLGLPEIVVIVLAALLIFGPDRLPKMAADAGKMLRQLRRMAEDVRTDLKDELGDTVGDLDLRDFTPRGLVQKHLLDPALDEVDDVKRSVKGTRPSLVKQPDLAPHPEAEVPVATTSGSTASATPYDVDAT